MSLHINHHFIVYFTLENHIDTNVQGDSPQVNNSATQPSSLHPTLHAHEQVYLAEDGQTEWGALITTPVLLCAWLVLVLSRLLSSLAYDGLGAFATCSLNNRTCFDRRLVPSLADGFSCA
eukprot:1740117-Amphidinium_carterae.1